MHKIKTVIIEDEPAMRSSLKAIITNYCTDLIVVGEADDIAPAIQLIQEHQPDIVFMDIRLPSGESFKILDHFPNANFEVIFVTAYADYLQKAFDYFSFQYLIKPVDIEKLELTIERYKQKRLPSFSNAKMHELKALLREQPEILTIAQSDGKKIILISEIVRLEADRGYTNIFLEDGTFYLSTKGIGSYQNLLEKHSFFRTHKSHLVNVKMIRKVSYQDGILLNNKEVIPLAQRSRKSFMEYLEKFGV